MEWLNYHHLYYFHVVAREGTIARASGVLRLAEPTISHQIRLLESTLGQPLFTRRGHRLILTNCGRTALTYADKIFALGHELLDAVKLQSGSELATFVVGLAEIIPKGVAFAILRAVIDLPSPVRIVCREGVLERLLADLGSQEIDLVLADSPVPSSIRLRLRSELLGESGISLLAFRDVARRYRERFPKSLERAPILVPTRASPLRRSLDQWFTSQHVRPRIVGEFEDMATMRAFGEAGGGLYPVMSVVEAEALSRSEIERVARIPTLRVQFYAITLARKYMHPAIQAILSHARRRLAP